MLLHLGRHAARCSMASCLPSSQAIQSCVSSSRHTTAHVLAESCHASGSAMPGKDHAWKTVGCGSLLDVAPDRPLAASVRRLILTLCELGCQELMTVADVFLRIPSWCCNREMAGLVGHFQLLHKSNLYMAMKDLMNPILENAVKAFSPLKIRLGGTLQDIIIYDTKSTIKPCGPIVKNQSALFGFSGGCLSMPRWDALNNFFQKTGSEVVFGLNALYGRHMDRFGPWNSTNAQELIQYSVDRGYKIQAWELGNELSASGIGVSIPAQQYADDIKELYRVVKEIYAGQPYQPLVVAPDGFFNDEKWFQDFLNKSGPGVVNVVSHHIYNVGSGGDTHLVQKILDPDTLDSVISTFADLRHTLKQYGPWASAWVGEAGGVYNSGRHLVTDAFVFGFWYLDQLGMAAKFGTRTYCRQSLLGGNYGLLDTFTYVPNPNYYGALLWHLLMGKKVLGVNKTGLSYYLRIYAHCSTESGKVSLVLLNLSNRTQYNVSLTSTSAILLSTAERQEYHLTAFKLQSQILFLNGKPLKITTDGHIPELTPKVASILLPISVAPLSIAFVTLPIDLPACL